MTVRAVALVAIAALSCGSPRTPSGVPAGTGPLVATYRAEFTRGDEPVRRARLVLWAELPDRLHAELLAPVGGVRLTVDAGGGRAAVVDAEENVAYVGAAGAEVVASLTGVHVAVGDVVAALLTGQVPDGATVERVAEADGVLPKHFRLAHGRAQVALTRTRWERSAAASAGLGTGAPPAGLAVRPIDELRESP